MSILLIIGRVLFDSGAAIARACLRERIDRVDIRGVATRRPATAADLLQHMRGGQSEKGASMSLARVRLTARLRLEPIGPGHAKDVWLLFQDLAVAEWYGGAWTHEQAQREAERMGRAWDTEGIHKWMAYHRLTGERVGRGGLSRTMVEGQTRLEIGWALHYAYWGQGYATEIGHAGLAVAFEELGAEEVVSYTETRNTRSRAVMERLRFRYSHDYRDEDDSVPCALYVLRRSRRREAPGE